MTDMPAPLVSAAPDGGADVPLAPRRMASLMRHALFLAEGGLGATAPNPSVGAVVADAATGEIIASAVTAPGGRPHAEVLALRRAGARARGAIIFTTLEPCSHFGATPPCAHSIVDAGITTAVYGSADPDMRVSGRGLTWLLNNGVRVLRGDFATEADWLNLGHTLRVTERRPFVQIKLAVDANGRVPVGAGNRPVWVTGEAARAQAHLLRARSDAILVGRRTIEADDPELTSGCLGSKAGLRCASSWRRAAICPANRGYSEADRRCGSSAAIPHKPVTLPGSKACGFSILALRRMAASIFALPSCG